MPPQFRPQFDPANKIPSPENNPMQQKPPRGHSVLIVVTILLLVTGVFGIWYFSNPLPEEETDGSTSLTTSQFADWKTYRNEEYGFEFKYPPTLQQQKETYHLDGLYYCSGKLKLGGESQMLCDELDYRIGVVVHDKKFSIDEIKKDYDTLQPILPDDTSPIKKYSINGKDFYIGRNSVYTFEGWLVHTALQDKILLLSFSGDGYVVPHSNSFLTEGELQKISQILSTFKFISTSTPAGKFCGGIAPGAFPCPTGYVCKLDGAYPDAGGHCVVPDGTGTLAGRVTIGPNCPVEQIDNPCVTPPEAYASREFSVTQNGKVITTFHADMTGNYIISLAPSTYIITYAKTGIGYMSKDLPVTVTIKAGEATILNIDVDTGIR